MSGVLNSQVRSAPDLKTWETPMNRRVIRIIPLLLVSAYAMPAFAAVGPTMPGAGRWILWLMLLVAGWIAEHRQGR